MQTWAKRGIQTALVTGGLLMLGTGIASADEDVNPDKPASPLDGSVTAPVKIDNNALGTPFGQKNLPGVNNEIKVSIADLTRSVPMADPATATAAPVAGKVQEAAAPVAAKVQDSVAPLTGQARDQAAPLAATTKPVTDKLAALPMGDKLPAVPAVDKVNVPGVDALSGNPAEGNRINADLVVPIDVSGNAIALLGKAETTNDSSQSYGHSNDVDTTGTGGFISGNVVDLDWALPVQITNNAIAGVGKASAEGTNSQEAWATGDIVTDGAHSVLGGNVVAPQFATPVQLDGNAVAGAGKADATSQAQTSAESGGTILTSGADSAGGGNAVPVPVAVPVKANGNAIMGLGKAVAVADSSVDATAGATRTGMYGVPTYVETNGDPALLAGNVAQPAASGTAALCGNATGAGGAADATCDTASETTAGGTSRSTGEGSVGSGSIAAAPVALPANGYGNAVPVAGNATTDATNTADSTAGGDSYTRGQDSVASGTTANAPVAAPAEVFANAAAGAGDATAAAANDTTATAGGNTGTTGDNSAGGGNMVTAPVTTAGEVFGNTAAGAGGADATASETKTVTAGGGSNTADDDGLGSSNLVTTPVATAAQAFGNSAGAVAFTDAKAKTDDKFSAGGDNKATGTGGLLSGNIGQVPVSAPGQVFGTGASGLAKGEQTAINETDMSAGGDAMSDGANGAGSGNVVTAPIAGAAQGYGESAAALGLNDSLAGSATETEAGGDTETDGTAGLISGNVASPQAMPLAQSFAAVASGVGGGNSSVATNETDAESGGDIDTAGDEGFISGNLVDVPAAAVAQPFGDAVSAVESNSSATGLSDTQGAVGGTSTTSGENGSLSGIDGTLPVGANVPVYDVPVEVLAQAFTESANSSDLQVGEGEPQVNLPVNSGLAPTTLPSMLPAALPMRSRSMPADPFQGAFSGVLTGFAGGMTGLPAQGQVTDVADKVSTGTLPEAPGEFHILPAPYPTGRAAAADPLSGLLGGNGGPLGLVSSLLGGGVTDNLAGLPVAGQRDLPTDSLGDLPIIGSLDGDFADLADLGAVQGFGGFGGRQDVPALPFELDFLPMFGDLNDVTTVIPAVPATDGLTDATTVIPVVPATGDLTDVTTVIPAVPALPGAGDVTAVPVAQAPSLNTLPVTTPELSGVQAPVVSDVAPMDASSLDATRAALANLFTTHPIA